MKGYGLGCPFFSLFLNISDAPNPYFCISISCGTVHLSWSLNQVSSALLPYLSRSGLAENTYVIFAANMPTGGKSLDYLDRETSEGGLGRAAFVRGQG